MRWYASKMRTVFSPTLKVCGGNAGSRRLSGSVFQPPGRWASNREGPTAEHESLSQSDRVGAKSPICARSASSTVTPSEKSSINTDRKFTHYLVPAFRWAHYIVRCPYNRPKGAPKRKTAAYGLKSHFDWITSAIKFLCVKTVSDKVGNSLA